MKLHLLNPATTGHSSLLTSATFWMDARRRRIQRQKVEKGTVPQVNDGNSALDSGIDHTIMDIADILICHINLSSFQLWPVLPRM